MITQEKIQALFEYRDGELWKPNQILPAGYINSDGYRQIWIEGTIYYAHRLIFLLEHSYLPAIVDHRKSKLNNIGNLRAATRSQNQYNTKTPKHNTSGLKGVSWNIPKHKWRAYINTEGHRKYLGYFKDLFSAACAIHSARNELHGAFANHG